MLAVSVKEARSILGSRAKKLTDQDLEKLIIFMQNLCSKFIEEVINEDENKKDTKKGNSLL